MQKEARVEIVNNLDVAFFSFAGCFDKNTMPKLEKNIQIPANLYKDIVFDFDELEFMDMSGARFVLELERKLKKTESNIKKTNLNQDSKMLLELCDKFYKNAPKEQKQGFDIAQMLYKFGKNTSLYFVVLRNFLAFMGAAVAFFLRSLANPKQIRFKATMYHLEQNALFALPIICITSLLVGVVLAYQGSVQLEQFGANIFIVDMVGISATRELAPLIAAIVIAGRSASSYAAQIGVMKITDEVDAMNAMGFNSWNFIILPRVLALVVGLFLLVIAADMFSILGGMIVADLNLGISFGEFFSRFQEAVELKHILIGFLKAPIFGWIIAMIGCFRGFEIKNTTQSVGVYTTKSVVDSIFWVIAFNALFSVFLTELGI